MPPSPLRSQVLLCTFGLMAPWAGASAGSYTDIDDDTPPQRRGMLVSPTTQIQTWVYFWDQDEDEVADGSSPGDPEVDPGFQLTRARFGLYGQYRWIDWRFRAGTAAPFDRITREDTPFDLVTARVNTRFRSVAGDTMLSIGLHGVHFAREMRMSANDLVYEERSLSTNVLAPNRDLGFTAQHTYKALRATVGAFNGNGSNYRDVDPGMLVAARIEASIGGDTYRTNATDDAFGFGAGWIHQKTASTRENRVTADLNGRIRGFSLLASGIATFIDPLGDDVLVPPDVLDTTIRWGFSAQLSWFGETGIGGIHPAVRFSMLDDNTDLSDAGDTAQLHVGATWREPLPFLSIGAGYIHRMELQGDPRKNDSLRMWVGFAYPSRNHPELNRLQLREDGPPPVDDLQQ